MLLVAVPRETPLVDAFFMPVVSTFVDTTGVYRPADALQSIRMARVVGGNTVHLRDGRSVRLIGISTPELVPSDHTTEPFVEATKQ